MPTVRVPTAHWPLLAAMAGVTLAGLPTLNFQYGPDQALFAYIGRKLVQGDVLYVDSGYHVLGMYPSVMRSAAE